jgi:7,8-dihydropterin-6-yl-methyl-4-(beta-D-ribofuranosyl)aminobenzene 5'-phosphate synthase
MMAIESTSKVSLLETDRVEITTVIDNWTDSLLPDFNKIAKRALLVKDSQFSVGPLAEHGLCLLIKVFRNSESHTILFDGGWSKIGVPFNLKVLGINPNEIEGVILSHGHADHFGSFVEVIKNIRDRIPFIAHPDAFLTTRYREMPNGQKVHYPSLDEQPLLKAGAEIIKTKSPFLLASGLISTTGEVERSVDFEKGLPNVYFERDGKIETDMILDDLAVIINVKNKGLVVVSGCAHSGIINTVRHAQKIAGVQKVSAILGGFHLSGPAFEPIIEKTIDNLKQIDPEIIVPMHCTGWKAIRQIAAEIPKQFIFNTVGTQFNIMH